MAAENPLQDLTFIAGADLSAQTNKGLAVKLDATENKVVVAGANEGTVDKVVGILKELAVADGFVTVASQGTVKALSGAAIAAHTLVKTDANGKVVTGGAGSDKNIGFTLDAAGGADELVEVLLIFPSLTS